MAKQYHRRVLADDAGSIERLMRRHERWMYRATHPNPMAAVLNGLWAAVGRVGVWNGRLVTLEVPGRRSGRPTSVPLILVDVADERYLVAMLGERSSWVRNVEAAGGSVLLHHGRTERARLARVDPAERGPIVRRHLEVAPAARAFFPISRFAPDDEMASAARAVPVFMIVPDA